MKKTNNPTKTKQNNTMEQTGGLIGQTNKQKVISTKKSINLNKKRQSTNKKNSTTTPLLPNKPPTQKPFEQQYIAPKPANSVMMKTVNYMNGPNSLNKSTITNNINISGLVYRILFTNIFKYLQQINTINFKDFLNSFPLYDNKNLFGTKCFPANSIRNQSNYLNKAVIMQKDKINTNEFIVKWNLGLHRFWINDFGDNSHVEHAGCWLKSTLINFTNQNLTFNVWSQWFNNKQIFYLERVFYLPKFRHIKNKTKIHVSHKLVLILIKKNENNTYFMLVNVTNNGTKLTENIKIIDIGCVIGVYNNSFKNTKILFDKNHTGPIKWDLVGEVLFNMMKLENRPKFFRSVNFITPESWLKLNILSNSSNLVLPNSIALFLISDWSLKSTFTCMMCLRFKPLIENLLTANLICERCFHQICFTHSNYGTMGTNILRII